MPPNNPLNGNGLAQLIRMRKSIKHKLVNVQQGSIYGILFHAQTSSYRVITKLIPFDAAIIVPPLHYYAYLQNI